MMEHMRRSRAFLGCLLLALLLVLLPPAVFADEVDAVAKIDRTYYETLQEAIDSVDSRRVTTITVLRDVEESIVVRGGQQIILSMGTPDGIQPGATVTGVDGPALTNLGTVTVKGMGIFRADGTVVVNQGTLKIMDGTFLNSGEEELIRSGDVVPSATVTVTGGYYSAPLPPEFCGTGLLSVTAEDGLYTVARTSAAVWISQGAVTLRVGAENDSVELSAQALPEALAVQDMHWSSSNEAVAVVDENGTVAAVSEGEAIITATWAYDGERSASCIVTVEPPIPVSGVAILEAETDLTVGDRLVLTAVVSPENAFERSVVWSSSDETVASVDENGTVTAIAAGTADITVTTADGGYSDVVTVTVSAPPVYDDPPVTTTIAEEAVPLAGVLPFDDVTEGDWYFDAVRFVYENELMSGVTDNVFGPGLDTSRAMIVTALWRLDGAPEAELSAFADVPADAYYARAVAWGAANGVVSGYDERTFAPDECITREQLAAFLYRYAAYRGNDTSAKEDALSQFSDAALVSDYARDSVRWAVGTGLLSGMGDGSLAPGSSATRAQAASILMRFCRE